MIVNQWISKIVGKRVALFVFIALSLRRKKVEVKFLLLLYERKDLTD